MSSSLGLNGSHRVDCNSSPAFDTSSLEDITETIALCAAILTVKDPFVSIEASFNLHDSMAATELTDRKMDCCEIPATQYLDEVGRQDHVVFPRPVPESLNDPFAPLPWDDLTLRESSFIALHMLLCFQSFLSGSSAGESTFMCLYVHLPVLCDMKEKLFGKRTLVDPINPPESGSYAQFLLFTCAVAVIDATDVVRSAIVNADVYEEEDFSPNTYDIPFFTDRESISTLKLLEAALHKSNEIVLEDRELLLLSQCILSFLFGFLSVCGSLGKLATETLRADVESLQQVCRLAVQRLDELKMVLPSVAFDNDQALREVFRLSFDPYINRPLVGNTPIRKPLQSTPADAIEALRNVAMQLDWAVCKLLLNGLSLRRAQRMLDRVQKSGVNILGRSLIVLNLYFEDKLFGQRPLVELIAEDMSQFGDIPESFMNHELTISFVERMAKPVYDTLKLRALNRCRQRSYIELVMLQDWINLSRDAHMIDAHFRESADEMAPAPFLTHYILSYLIRVMDQHLAVGLELGIFCSHLDISMAYWYRDFLLSALLNILSTRRRSTIPTVDPDKARTGRSTKNVSGRPADSASLLLHELHDDPQDVESEMILVSVQRDLCRGLKRFIAALCQAGVVSVPEYEFTTQERIFEERFAMFALVPRPPPLTFQDYVHGSDFTGLTSDELLSTASSVFRSAKVAVERLIQDVRQQQDQTYALIPETDLRALLKVCVGNNVYLLKLRSLIDAKVASQAKLDFVFEGTTQFCTIKLS